MLFNSLTFLYAFLPPTYVVFWLLKSKTQRYAWLTVTGYGFYAAWNYKFCALMAFSTVVAYVAGLGLLNWQAKKVLVADTIALVIDPALARYMSCHRFPPGYASCDTPTNSI